MSDELPFEIQSEIMKRLPVRSLLRFRSVSKSCKSFIDNSHFIKHYIGQQQHLLVNYADPVEFTNRYVSIVDDDDDHTFHEQKVSVIIPPSVQKVNGYSTIGTSHGLFCFLGLTGRAVIRLFGILVLEKQLMLLCL
ncbi:putative F-box domain-containing protein [Helianthus anomalus]